MGEMLEAIQLEFDLDTEDPPMPEVEEFFRFLKASEELLHGHESDCALFCDPAHGS
jgi:hypothetical protein